MLKDTVDCNTVNYGHAQKLQIVTSHLVIICDVLIESVCSNTNGECTIPTVSADHCPESNGNVQT